MPVAENRALLESYIREVWDKANLDAIEVYLDPSFQRHVSSSLPPIDRDGQITRLTGFRAAFPDITITVEDVVAEGDRVAFRSTMRGTHLGEFLGIPATGKKVAVGLVDIVRIEDGRFREQWGGPDIFDMLRQLGATHSVET